MATTNGANGTNGAHGINGSSRRSTRQLTVEEERQLVPQPINQANPSEEPRPFETTFWECARIVPGGDVCSAGNPLTSDLCRSQYCRGERGYRALSVREDRTSPNSLGHYPENRTGRFVSLTMVVYWPEGTQGPNVKDSGWDEDTWGLDEGDN
ncbi:hypothetical protein S40288_10855 [Stachybotrys chartarum IBT 40288]|nr:hypothetical protein S40288_10855 [Stachybotrys chartarum IBT 40288]